MTLQPAKTPSMTVNQYVLGVDIDTSGVKIIALRQDSEVSALAQI